ncbi:hypothetical protein [Paenibacillus piri]|uniref:DNA topology modulation protein FlaR n=1 Tax=Paenibacillus piri TaxID=2547395 RepID=A0A4R5KW93_9BACL|nr:hypothetical protein [Paenibacillus piri]TDF99782.1 hypothetical protein E1757_08180 [Paenibacillus piri]
MKIRIIGSCGSGKSSAAMMLSMRYGIPFYEMDNLVWDRTFPENRRRPEAERNAMLLEIMNKDAWIIEGVHSAWGLESFAMADLIFILHPHVLVRDYRILRRFFRSRTGIEPWNYKQSVRNLWKMIVKWNHGFDLADTLELTSEHSAKRYIVRSREDMDVHIRSRFGNVTAAKSV